VCIHARRRIDARIDSCGIDDRTTHDVLELLLRVGWPDRRSALRSILIEVGSKDASGADRKEIFVAQSFVLDITVPDQFHHVRRRHCADLRSGDTRSGWLKARKDKVARDEFRKRLRERRKWRCIECFICSEVSLRQLWILVTRCVRLRKTLVVHLAALWRACVEALFYLAKARRVRCRHGAAVFLRECHWLSERPVRILPKQDRDVLGRAFGKVIESSVIQLLKLESLATEGGRESIDKRGNVHRGDYSWLIGVHLRTTHMLKVETQPIVISNCRKPRECKRCAETERGLVQLAEAMLHGCCVQVHQKRIWRQMV